MRRSAGLSLAEFRDGAYVHDAATDTIHRIGPIAGALLADRDVIDVRDVIDAVATVSRRDHAEVTAEVTAGIDTLRSLGLLDRLEPVWVPGPISGSELDRHGDPVGVAHVVHDRRLVFRSPDLALLAEIDRYLGDATTVPDTGDGEPVVFDVVPEPGVGLVLHAAEEWGFPDIDALLIQLPGVVNDFAVRSHTIAILHAGGVVTPAGQLLLISGDAESGKSTLVAALVQQGCDYLTDELIGIDPRTGKVLPFPKPLELDETSCDVLGVIPDHLPNVLASELRRDVAMVTTPVGPVDAVILPTYRAGAERETTRLNVEAAAKALLNQTMNMRRVREPGLRAVCDFAAATPVTRIVHGDSVALADAIISGEVPI